MKPEQQTLMDITWVDEPEEYNSNIEEWVKLELGDALAGTYVHTFKDKKFNKDQYVFENAIVIMMKDGSQKNYECVAITGTTNLSNKMKKYDPIERPLLKIIHIKDLPTDQGNDLQIYKIQRPETVFKKGSETL